MVNNFFPAEGTTIASHHPDLYAVEVKRVLAVQLGNVFLLRKRLKAEGADRVCEYFVESDFR